MCLVKFSKDDDDHHHSEPPRPVHVRRRPSVSHSTRTSQIVIRHPSTPRHSHKSITRITSSEPAPRASQYIIAPPSDGPGPGPAPAPGPNFPMIVHAPTPPNRSPLNSPRVSHAHVFEGSPRNSRASVQSRHSARSRRESQRHGRSGSGNAFIVDPPAAAPQPRARSRSVGAEGGERVRLAESYVKRNVTVTGDGRPRSREPSRERRSKVYLTTPLSEREVDAAQRGLETSRDGLRIEDGGQRGRSITYETNPRMSVGRLAERERVFVEEDGRRREFYKSTSLNP